MGKWFEQENVFPIIKEIIEQICRQKAQELSNMPFDHSNQWRYSPTAMCLPQDGE